MKKMVKPTSVSAFRLSLFLQLFVFVICTVCIALACFYLGLRFAPGSFRDRDIVQEDIIDGRHYCRDRDILHEDIIVRIGILWKVWFGNIVLFKKLYMVKAALGNVTSRVSVAAFLL